MFHKIDQISFSNLVIYLFVIWQTHCTHTNIKNQNISMSI